MKGKIAAAVAALALLGTSHAFAQSAPSASSDALHKGMNEVRVDAQVTHTSRQDADGGGFVNTNVEYFKFVTDRLSFGPQVYLSKNVGSDTTGGYGIRAAYHFGKLDAKVVPFVEASLRRTFGLGDSNGPETSLFGGVKIYTGKPGAVLVVGPYFYRGFYNADKNDGYTGFKSIGLSWSLGVVF